MGQQQVTTPSHPGFSKRWGHVLVVRRSQYRTIYDARANNVGENVVDKLVVLGGDDFAYHIGGGGFRNDVWQITGLNWETTTSYYELNEYDAGRTFTVSKTKWMKKNPGA